MLDRPLAVVDVETTGLSPRYGDRVVEIGLLRVEGASQVTFESFVNPRRLISPRATAVHGITEEMVATAPPFAEVAKRVWQLLDGAVLVGHNVGFDWSFLNAERRYLGLPPLEGPLIDTLVLARRYFAFSRNGLGTIALELGLPERVRHRALADVLTTWEVLKRFLADLRAKGVTALEALLLPSASLPEEDAIPLPPELAEAITGRRRVRLQYVSAHRVETVREVEPLEVMPLGDYLYLRAFCHLRQDERTFRLDRIVAMERPDSPEAEAADLLPGTPSVRVSRPVS
ncbi:MAG: WYL domain-containing protein [Candidatus Rokubacteria bacterium]|nr:WYL domain-containing protein [Candidatus Rokubacteria bacterium]